MASRLALEITATVNKPGALASSVECATRGYKFRLREAQKIDPATNGIMVDNAGRWFGHRDYHPTTTLKGTNNMGEDEALERELNRKLTMTAMEIFDLHPLPWSHHLLLIKDANGRQVIHVGGLHSERNELHQGEYLSGLNALLVEAVNTRAPKDFKGHCEGLNEGLNEARLTAALGDALDVLQSVRKLLSTTKRRDLLDGPCWCVVHIKGQPHTEDCERTGEVWGRLKIRE